MSEKPPNYYVNPRHLFLKTLVTVFLAEFFVMLLLYLFPEMPLALEAFLDAFLLSILVVPFLYYFLLRPIQKTIRDRERKEAESSELKKMNMVKSEFISTAAHELRTPLATIIGYAELLSDQSMVNTFKEEQKRNFSSTIYESGVKLDKIIDDILDVSRIESGQKIPLNKKVSSIKTLVEKVLGRLHFQSNQSVTLEITPQVPDELQFDEFRIEQVLENLLSNAIKFSPPHSPISITVEADPDRCSITVTDLGIGMSVDQKERIFEKFYRADTTNTAVPGLGLGMSIVKQIIDDHDGTISIESKVGKGTSVCFTLPR